MNREFIKLILRIKYYIFLMGAFLGIEIPLAMFAYFKIFPDKRNYVWLVTLGIGVLTGAIVYGVIKSIIKEDYRLKILFNGLEYIREGKKR